ncbi:pre-mRNA-splicing factor SYF2 [Ixodes scapularis]|uniref:Pre-mRNA-splicing factor SYF2 n=2 Tax=Ixodes TaxID=6944 RepID=A0A0K8R9Q9_IXORI|nr:pre-mRNA-splicing factor SYF2 [Ixodes scapularis]
MSEKPSCSSSASKRSEQLERLRNLHMRRNEARTLNYQEVVEEDRKTKLPANWENKQKWAQYKLDEEKNYEDASKRGEDYARLKLLNVSADEAERLDRKKKRKNPDFGFSDYEAATVRQYTRLVKQIKPDMEVYERKKEELGEALYPTRDTIIHGLHKDSKEDVDRMVQDLEKQIDKRNKYSRRRRFNDDEDIDYINERNMKFNKKLERFYGQYTAEIKQNLERGTAV